MTKSILLVGVGGQGTILASKILTTGLMEAGYDGTVSLEVDGPPDTQLCVRSCYFLKKVLNC